MTARPKRCPLPPVTILALANTHTTPKIKAVYSFSKRDMIVLAEAMSGMPISVLPSTNTFPPSPCRTDDPEPPRPYF